MTELSAPRTAACEAGAVKIDIQETGTGVTAHLEEDIPRITMQRRKDEASSALMGNAKT